MAAPNISEVLTTTLSSRTKHIRDNVTNNNALLAQINKKGRIKTVSGGVSIYEELSYTANTNGAWYSGYDLLSTGSQEVLTSAEFAWKQYAVGVIMSGLEMLQNRGPEAMIDLMEARVENAEATMANAIATGVYGDGTAYGGKSITGLDAAVPQDPTTGTYGGINRATASNTFWRTQLYDPSSTPTASTIQAYMTQLWAQCTLGSDFPDLIVAGQTIWTTWMSSLQLIQRITDPDSANLGFPSTKFMGSDVVMDNVTGIVATDMYFLNTKHLKWRPHADRNMVPIGGDRTPINQDAVAKFIGFAGNLTCAKSRVQGRLKGD